MIFRENQIQFLFPPPALDFFFPRQRVRHRHSEARFLREESAPAPRLRSLYVTVQPARPMGHDVIRGADSSRNPGASE